MKVRWATLTTVTSRIAITVAKMHTPEIRSSAASSLSGYSRSVAPGCPVGACGGVLAAAYGASSMALLSISNRPDSPTSAAANSVIALGERIYACCLRVLHHSDT